MGRQMEVGCVDKQEEMAKVGRGEGDDSLGAISLYLKGGLPAR